MFPGKPHLPANLEVAIFSSCRNIKGEPQILGSSPSPVPRTIFPLGCNCMMSLGKPKLSTKFEVASFSRCKNNKGELQIFGSSPGPWPRPIFLLVLFMMAHSCVPNLMSLASAVAKILKGNSKSSGGFPRTWPRPLFLCVGFYDGPW